MFIEFSAANFLSINDKITLNLLASKDNSLDYHLIKSPVLKEKSLLKTSAVYGANASGKSNVLKALYFFKNFILNSHKMQQGDEINIVPFKLDEKSIDKPSQFEIVFIFNGIRYAYGFSVDYEKVYEEYLYYFPKGRQSLVFERENTNEYTFTVDKKEQKELSMRTPQNTLYFSSATRWNYQGTAAPFEWLRNHLKVVTTHEKMSFWRFTAQLASQDGGIIKTINQSLMEADLGINALKISKEKTSNDTARELNGEWQPMFPAGKSLTLHTQHVGIDKEGNEKTLYFKLEEESDGTQKFFSLLGPFIDVLMNGYVLFIDELEASLHPHLTKFLVNLFHNPAQNKNNAQLIFTTHDTNLLNLLRRDQVWFTEKNPKTGSTDLYSLLEFSPRKDQNIEKGYLSGRYGAVPFLGDGKIL